MELIVKILAQGMSNSLIEIVYPASNLVQSLLPPELACTLGVVARVALCSIAWLWVKFWLIPSHTLSA